MYYGTGAYTYAVVTDGVTAPLAGERITTQYSVDKLAMLIYHGMYVKDANGCIMM
jgi:hypothetical protein